MTAAALYPSYKDVDPFIDVARLRALDQYVRERLEARLARERDLRFYTGPFLLEDAAPSVPGPRMVALSRSARAEDYYDLDRPEVWSPSEDAAEFPELMDFIASLPFKARGRMLIIYDPEGRAVPAHRDHDSDELCHEFIWFRTNLDKPFFMLNPGTGEKLDVASHAAWFDTVNQYHGAEATGRLSFSIRVDGVFTDAFRAMIPWPASNRASAPSLWARCPSGADRG
ncbi:MAG TPA: hypothetical protein VGB54_03350 [Allosphingosinicella sp.]